MKKMLVTIIAFTLFLSMPSQALAASAVGESDQSIQRVYIMDAVDNER